MYLNRSLIQEWCKTLVPPSTEEFFQNLATEDDKFTDEEGPYWDFKDQWPFSYSDGYFGGIARLICAFANANGGVIIFGVHDKYRTGGNNKVQINLDRFSQALKQLIGHQPELRLQHYPSDQLGSVNALFVRPRPTGTPPYRFGKAINNYGKGTLWIRSGHEVVSASPAHFPVLFCRVDTLEGDDVYEVDGSLPPSPARLKRFVGRTEVMDHMFTWFESSDEPRSYLYGKGGSGKTTIAYEFAKLIRNHGRHLKINDSSPVDSVIFLSAKEKELNPITGQTIDIKNPDFTDEFGLLRNILKYGGWTNDDSYLSSISIDQLRNNVKEFFDINSTLLVLDDIDTLTTKGIDPGFDFLYRTLCRSRRPSKVLYTLRNAPTQSLMNSIEVPGLDGDDYEIFVNECATNLSVPSPTKEFQDHKLTEISERRPLVIESVIALVRTAGSYERAADLFIQHSGDDIRDYVFLREWDALKGGTLSKLLLAGLSDFDEPANFSDLQTVLQAESSRVKDAIGSEPDSRLVSGFDCPRQASQNDRDESDLKPCARGF